MRRYGDAYRPYQLTLNQADEIDKRTSKMTCKWKCTEVVVTFTRPNRLYTLGLNLTHYFWLFP